MAYKRRPGAIRRYARKAFRYVKQNPTRALALARTAWKTAKYVKGLVNTEFKYADNAAVSRPTITVPDLIGFNGLAQGDTASLRNGNQFRVKSLQFRGYVQIDPTLTALTNTNMFRFILFIDKQPKMGTPTISDLLTTTGNPRGLRNYEKEKTDRFTVLYDRMKVVDSQKPTALINVYKKLDMVTRFDGTTATDISKNALYMFVLSDNSGVSTNAECQWSSRIRFIDN